MEPTISLSRPSLVKKTCMTTKGKGKRREPSSLPHIRGARLLPSAGSLLSPSTRPVLSSPNGACVYMRACTRAHACLLEPRALKGACTAGAEGVRAGGTCVEYMCGVALAHVRARAWRTGIRVPRVPFSSFWFSLAVLPRLSFYRFVFLLVEKATREEAI